MKRIYLSNILIFLSAFTAMVDADNAAMPASNAAMPASAAISASTNIDPTLAFFSALSSCTAGTYTEKNVLTTEVGQPNLTQQIIGPSDDQTACIVTLQTPDNRTMNCAFPMSDLAAFSDQHFLQGIDTDTTDSQSQDSINADVAWSQMKMNNCSLGDGPADAPAGAF